MPTDTDLALLARAEPDPGVSILLPTHPFGAESRQNPVQLRRLLGEAERLLEEAGEDADALLEPARALLDDREFWRRAGLGLALYLDSEGMRVHVLSATVEECVRVGDAFQLLPLLPGPLQPGPFRVLALARGAVRLYDGTQDALVERAASGLPRDLDETMERAGDYENPLNAPPASAHGHGTTAMGKAQVFGDAPEEWRKTRLRAFVAQVAAAIEADQADRPTPVVLVAEPELAGQFRKVHALGPAFAGVVDTNPGALREEQLHGAALDVLEPWREAPRRHRIEQARALLGSRDGRVADAPAAIGAALAEGRVEALLVPERDLHDDAARDKALLDRTWNDWAVGTLRQGGVVHVVNPASLPEAQAPVAILRW